MAICPVCKKEFSGRPNKLYDFPRCKMIQKRRVKADRVWTLFLANNPGMDFSSIKRWDEV